MPSDVLAANTALNVIGEYELFVNATIIYAWIMLTIFIFVNISIKISENGRKVKKYVIALLIQSLMMILLGLGLNNVVIYTWANEGTWCNGTMLNFVSRISTMSVEKPVYYNCNEIEIWADELKNVEQNDNEEMPNIIVIMDESFADFSVLGEALQVNQSITSFVESLQENTIKGYALSSIYGGGTPNSEYEVLTGNSMFFLPSGAIPYQQYVNEDTYSMVSVMSDLDYKCIGMHPYLANGWMRESVYPLLGFDESYFLDDFAQENMVRNCVSDQEMFEKIIDEYEQLEEDENLFLFGVTMQNHGGYEYDGENFEQSIELDGYSQEYPKVEQYLSLIHETDKAVEYLITYFESVEEDVVIIFYGDYFPALDEELYEEVHGEAFDTLDEEQLKYTVPFFIWANYDIEEGYVECTSLNYLSNYLYKVAGINLPTYNLFLEDMQSVVPAINANGYYSLANERYMTFEEAEGEEAEWLEKYQILQYNCLFDEEHRNIQFFPLN